MKGFSFLLPYVFLLLILIFIFLYLIPSYYIDKVKNRQIKIVLISFTLAYIFTKALYLSLPVFFRFSASSFAFSIILALIAYVGGEVIGNKTKELADTYILCDKCERENPSDADFCMHCGEELEKRTTR